MAIEQTRVDRWIASAKNHKYLSKIILAAVILVGTATVVESVFKIITPFSSETKEEPVVVEEQAIPEAEAPVTDFIAPKMVEIPAGTFMMGSDTSENDHERSAHQVAVSALELARNELTWAEWQACEAADGCNKIERPSFFDEIDASEQGRHPVVNVNVASVYDYLIWISDRTGRRYRLPSEAEWEYAARAGSTDRYYWGSAIGENRANCIGCNSPWDANSTAPVGSFDANLFGLNDMHGNVAELVADCWHANYNGAPTDGSAWVDSCTNADRRVIRGGGWLGYPAILLASSRGYLVNEAADSVGFRLARTLP